MADARQRVRAIGSIRSQVVTEASANPPRAEAALRSRFAAAQAAPTAVVLEGFHAVKHALRFGAEVTDVVSDDPHGLEVLLATVEPELAARIRAAAQSVETTLVRELAPRAPASPLLAIAERRVVDAHAVIADRRAPVILLDEPRHAGNAGAVVRVAAAADAAGVVMLGSLDPWSASVVRAAAGLHYAVPVAGTDRVEVLDDRGDRPLVALDPDGGVFDPRTVPPDAIFAFGSERHGLSDDVRRRSDAVVALPMRPGVSSLNLATSVSAVLYALQLAATES